MSDLISRSVLINKLEKWKFANEERGYDTAKDLVQEMIDLTKEQESVADGWIPVEERLPESNKPVLCWVRSATIASGETFIIGSCDCGFWFLQTYEIGHHHFPVKDYEVIAWQPLPEPFKAESEE